MIDFENIPIIKMFIEKARLEERERAHAEGDWKAEMEAYTDVLLQIIKHEFGKRGVEELEPRIRAIADGQKLARLITPALQSPSVEAFKEILERV